MISDPWHRAFKDRSKEIKWAQNPQFFIFLCPCRLTALCLGYVGTRCYFAKWVSSLVKSWARRGFNYRLIWLWVVRPMVKGPSVTVWNHSQVMYAELSGCIVSPHLQSPRLTHVEGARCGEEGMYVWWPSRGHPCKYLGLWFKETNSQTLI